MSDQHIGVKAQFLTPQFSRGLATYLKGLSQAIAATNQTVAAMNNLGASSAVVFAALGSNARATANALRNVANAAAAANRALSGQGRRRSGATTTSAAAQAGGLSPALINATTQANAAATAQINLAARATRNLGQQARQAQISVSGLNAKTIALGTILGNLAASAIKSATSALVNLGGKVLEVVSFFERLDLSIAFFTAQDLQATDATLSFSDALAATESQAQGLSIWLQRLAVASPFTTRTVGTLFRTAQAYGLTRSEAEQLTPLLLDLGAASGLSADILERLALALGQVRARGKLTGEEVRQLGNSGLRVRDILVKALGIANSEFDDLLENGALTSDVVLPHLIAALKTLEGAGERVAFGTIGGIVSSLEDLQEISTARFFIGFLEPLKESIKELFQVINQPEVLAFITILGQELGVKFRDAVFDVVGAIKSYLVAWQQLDPAVKQQIIVFGAATAGVFALAAAFGLLTLAMGVIANPLVLIATTIGFLVSEWTSGFAVLRNVTGRAGRAIGNTLVGIVRGFGALLTGFGDFVVELTGGFNTLEGQIARFGFGIGASLAEGIAASGGILADALSAIGKLLSFWLAPGSPPRIAPDIDDWGKATMEEYIKAFGHVNVPKSLGNGLSIVSDNISDELIKARRDAVDRLNQLHPDLNLSLAQDLQRVVEEGYKKTQEEFADSEPVEAAATDAGIRVSESFVDGFLSRLPQLTPRISDELQEVLNKIGRGAQLTRQGALAFGNFLGGFDEADFGVLDTVTDVIQSFFQNLVETGEIEEVDLPRLLFGARQDLAQGIQDIERVGHVTERTMQSIRATAGGAGKFVIDLLSSYAPLADATERVEEAQNRLNDITDKYKAIITPLRRELEAINEANRLADDEEKILSLRRLIANEAVSDRRRRNAQLEIDQIIAEQRVRGLEKERDAATETAETELEAREKTRDQLDDQFQTLQRNIQAQLQQLGLFGQEAAIIKRLREEAEKLQEKELTQEELQLKMLELQDEELQDLIAAARAKYDLDRADSTELERQQAQITLAEVALRRRNRVAEAIKLGIPPEELTKMRDFLVTLDDIGVKSKEAFDFEGASTFGQSIVDADAITRQWETTLEEVRDRWTEIKTQITETLTQINTNLPSFLKIFPEVEGGEPPIIGFIKSYTGVLVGLAVAMTTYKIVARIAALVTAVRSLALTGTLAGAGGAAAAAGGAAAGTAGLTGIALFIATLTQTLIAFVAISAAAVLAAQAVGAAFGALGFGQEIVKLGDFGQLVQDQIDDLVHNIGVGGIGGAAGIPGTLLEERVKTSVETAISNGLSNVEVTDSAVGAINQAIVDGLIADTPENRATITSFRTQLLEILNETRTGSEIAKIDLLAGTEIAPVPQEAVDAAKQRVDEFTNSLTDDERQRVFAEQVKTYVQGGFNMGLTDADISTQMATEFNNGVAAGLVADTPTNRQAIATYVHDLLLLLRQEGEIESPSKLTRREIGVPIGEGIIDGINDAILAQRGSVFRELGGVFSGMKTLMVLRMAEITLNQKTSWAAIRATGETEAIALKTNVLITFGSLLTTLTARMLSIKSVVVTGFTTMRTEAEKQAILLRTNIVKVFAGEDGSILDAIELVFLGKDDIVPRNIGKDFITGIGLGITENRDSLANSLTRAMAFALGEAQSAMLSGVNAPLNARFGGNVSTPSAATTTNFSRTNHYHLNVGTNQTSQGIVSDFGIMRTMER